jgi:hypothetical protein
MSREAGTPQPSDPRVEAASRRADRVAERATDEWWAALFAELDKDAATGPEGNGHRPVEDENRRVLTEAALRRMAEERRASSQPAPPAARQPRPAGGGPDPVPPDADRLTSDVAAPGVAEADVAAPETGPEADEPSAEEPIAAAPQAAEVVAEPEVVATADAA